MATKFDAENAENLDDVSYIIKNNMRKIQIGDG